MSQEKLKEILIALQDSDYKTPKAKREIFFQALNEINRIVMECLPPKSLTQATTSGAWFESEYDEGFNKAIAEFKANWEGK